MFAMSRSFLVDSLITPHPCPSSTAPGGGYGNKSLIMGSNKGGPCPLGTHPDALSLYSCRNCVPFSPFAGGHNSAPPLLHGGGILRPVPLTMPLYPPFLLPAAAPPHPRAPPAPASPPPPQHQEQSPPPGTITNSKFIQS